MSKLISKSTKKNIERVTRKLDSEVITIRILGQPEQTMSSGEALLLGNRLLGDRRENHALQIAMQLAEKHPDIIDVHLLKIRALLKLEKLIEVKELIHKYLQLAPENIGVLLSASRLQIILGNIAAAQKYLKLASQLKPNNIETLLQTAALFRASGDVNKAKKVILKCLLLVKKKKRGSKGDLKQYNSILWHLSEAGGITDEQFDELKRLAETADLDTAARSVSYYSLAAHMSKKSKSSEEQFLKIANSLEAESINHIFTTELYEKYCQKELTEQQALFPSKEPVWLNGYMGNNDSMPVFILGMPRSGTTLIEQIFGSHSKIGQTGESKSLGLGINYAYEKHQPAYSLQDFPMGFSKTPHATLDDIADYYIKYQQLLTSSDVYIDKDLLNYKYVGLAGHLFPRAKFIHMNRAPLDIFLSCYKNSIPGVPATTNISHMAIRYVYMKKLIGYWKKIYPDKIYIMNYADLVDDPEKNVREALRFLNLDFQPQILEFYKRKNVVRTLSVDQVRQSIYKTSVEKWRPYSDMLAPAIQVLNDHNIDTNGVRFL